MLSYFKFLDKLNLFFKTTQYIVSILFHFAFIKIFDGSLEYEFIYATSKKGIDSSEEKIQLKHT